MKKILLLIVGFYFTNLHAQLPTVQQYQTQQTSGWQTALSTLKTDSQYTSDLEILYDKVTPFAGLYTYNETDNNASSAPHFKQALSELYRASDQLIFESSEILQSRLNAHNELQRTARILPYYSTIVRVGIINTAISYLNYNDEFPNDGGVKLINGVYVPANNLPPFIQKQATIVSPLEELILTPDNNVTYQFNTTEMYQWGDKQITTMTADFGDGVTRTLLQNQQWVQNTITINYTTVNENKLLKFNITYTDGTTLTTYAGIGIGSDTSVNSLTARGTSGLMRHNSTIPDSNGATGQLEYRIFYGDQNTNNVLKKPFIIVDGFDPGDKRRIVTVDCNSDCQKLFKPFDPLKYESIEALMLYNNKTKDLKAQLTALNYDVIIVNFPTYTNNLGQVIDGGADDIFRNGRTVASFFQKINQDIKNNGSTEKLVVIGPSMGGQITRYALAYMEKKQQETNDVIWNHNTRLWVSMDSPHQGASIPLATQADLYFLGELLGKDDAKSKYRDVINSKASRQMLLTIAGAGSNFYNTQHDTNNQELIASGVANSKGYPVLNGIRKIAIANGSLSGAKNVIPSEKFYEIVALAKLRSILTFGIRIAKVSAFRINNWFMPDKNSTSMLLQNYSKAPEGAISWNLTNNLWMGSLDAVPGGSFNAADDLKREVYNELEGTNAFSSPYGLFPYLWTGERLIVEQRIPNSVDITIAPQAFIPTHSALDTNGFSDWYQPIDKNLVCTNQTPFNSFYGESTNMGHITFTDKMVDWLLKELSGQPQIPSFPVQANQLTGASMICLNANSIYQFTDTCKVPSAVTWSVSPNIQIVSSNTYGLTIKGLTSGNGTITATFQNGFIVTKTIWVGVPQFNEFTFGSLGSTQSLCIASANDYSYSIPELNSTDEIISNFSGLTSTEMLVATNWEWQKLNGLIILNGTKNSRNVCTIGAGQTSVSVRAKNACGWSDWVELPFEITELPLSWRQSQPIYTIYPNPSSDFVNIKLRDHNLKPKTTSQIKAELYDLMGHKKGKVEIVNNSATINVAGLPKGIYVLNINIDGQIEGHQVIVE